MAGVPGLPGQWATVAERRAGVPAAPHQVVEHFMTNDHLVHAPVRGEKDLVPRVPVPHTVAARAGKALTRHDHPLDAVEIAAESRTRLGLHPPLLIDRRWLPRLTPRGVEAAGGEHSRKYHEGAAGALEHESGQGNGRADRRRRCKPLSRNTDARASRPVRAVPLSGCKRPAQCPACAHTPGGLVRG